MRIICWERKGWCDWCGCCITCQDAGCQYLTGLPKVQKVRGGRTKRVKKDGKAWTCRKKRLNKEMVTGCIDEQSCLWYCQIRWIIDQAKLKGDSISNLINISCPLNVIKDMNLNTLSQGQKLFWSFPNMFLQYTTPSSLYQPDCLASLTLFIITLLWI